MTKCGTDSEDILVVRRSCSYSDMWDCASRKSQMNASTIRQRNKSGNVLRERIDAELLKKGLGNVSESKLWFRTVGELLVIITMLFTRVFILL